MAGMSEGYRNAIADHGASLITHIGLVDENGVELDGGNPAYARKEVTWVGASDGTIRPNADLVFNVPGSTKVAGWRGFDQLAHPGGTNYGGKDLTEETYTNQGEYKLLAADSGIKHENA